MIDDVYEMEFIQKIRTKINRQASTVEASKWISEYNINKIKTWPEIFTNQLNEKLSDSKNVPNFEMNNTEATYTMKVVPTWM